MQKFSQLGISVGSQLDSFFTVSAPFYVLPALVSSSEVSYVEIAKGCKAELDVSSEAVKAARARDANDLPARALLSVLLTPALTSASRILKMRIIKPAS